VQKKAIAVKLFWSLDLKRYFRPGDEVPDEVAKKAAPLGLVRYEAPQHQKQESEK